MAVVKRDKRSMSASSEESGESWSHVTPEDDPHEETSSFIQLSEGSVTVAAPTLTPHSPIGPPSLLTPPTSSASCRSNIHARGFTSQAEAVPATLGRRPPPPMWRCAVTSHITTFAAPFSRISCLQVEHTAFFSLTPTVPAGLGRHGAAKDHEPPK